MRNTLDRSSSTPDQALIAPVTPREFAASQFASKRQVPRSARRRTMVYAAAELFSQLGYRQTAVRDVANAAGCTEKSIYREFGGKRGLLEDVIREACECSHIPSVSRALDLCEEIRKLTEWEVVRVKRQNETLQRILPRDSSDPKVVQLAANLGLARSTEIISERLHQYAIDDGQCQFLVYTIQAIGLRLSWTSTETVAVARKVRQAVDTLAAAIDRHE